MISRLIRNISISTRQVLVPVLCFLAISLSGQGETCETAIAVGIGVHFSDGPFTGFGASGMSCGNAGGEMADHADWFLFIPPADGFYTITSTIDPNTTDTRLKIWDGSNGCGQLICVDGDDDSGVEFTSLVQTCLTQGLPYYIEWDDRWNSSGFIWQITLDTEVSCAPPENESCAQAFPISLGTSVTGFTTFASVDNPGLCDDVTVSTSGGIWYQIAGNGNIYDATTCMPGTNFDTQISVFEGSCSSLVCVAGNDDQAGPLEEACDGTNISLNTSSSLSWQTADGVLYFIYVTGYQNNSGFAELLVSGPGGPCGQPSAMTVTETEDGMAGSLRTLVSNACAGDTIYFDPALTGDTLQLSSGEVAINKDLVIIGPENGTILNGGGVNRIFRIYPNRILEMSHLTLTGGSNGTSGGAFLNEGTVKLTDIIFSQNFESGIPKAFSNSGHLEFVQGNTTILN